MNYHDIKCKFGDSINMFKYPIGQRLLSDFSEGHLNSCKGFDSTALRPGGTVGMIHTYKQLKMAPNGIHKAEQERNLGQIQKTALGIFTCEPRKKIL